MAWEKLGPDRPAALVGKVWGILLFKDLDLARLFLDAYSASRLRLLLRPPQAHSFGGVRRDVTASAWPGQHQYQKEALEAWQMRR